LRLPNQYPVVKKSQEVWDALVVGGGAAGMFAALRAKQLNPALRIAVLERGPRYLRKVSISGGGRCNVTHHCRDIDRLVGSYPRGGLRLEALLGRFMPEDTVDWFQARGVRLKTEEDGRMFPVTDRSQTVVDCLLKEADKLGVELLKRTFVKGVKRAAEGFELSVEGEGRKVVWRCQRLLLATGGASRATGWLKVLGHQLEPDIPSLFTFCVDHPLLQGLAGLSVDPVEVRLRLDQEFEATGPLLITHWGLSGPAILKLSAFAARELFARDYRAELQCDLLPELEREELLGRLQGQNLRKQVSARSPFPGIPRRFWQRLVERSDIGRRQSWGELKQVSMERLITSLKDLKLPVGGRGHFKEEFVTSGGLPLHELDVYTMESRRVKGLYVAGELLNVDGITGGFNFQNAWASGYVAGEGLSGLDSG
jgi:predicted Rossmann fold flavoprotein